MNKTEFEQSILEEIKNVDVEFLDPRKDYRRPLDQFRVNRRGDLLIRRDRTRMNDGWEILIPKERLTESDWISHMRQKGFMDFGHFVCAYMKALEMRGVKSLQISIYGFCHACRFADGK